MHGVGICVEGNTNISGFHLVKLCHFQLGTSHLWLISSLLVDYSLTLHSIFRLEQTFASLKVMFLQMGNNINVFFQSQIINTLTVFAIEFEFMVRHCQTCACTQSVYVGCISGQSTRSILRVC